MVACTDVATVVLVVGKRKVYQFTIMN